MSPTRRQVLAGAAAGALGAAGIYELVDQLASSPPKRTAAGGARAARTALAPGDQGRPPERRRGARSAAPSRGDDGHAEGRGLRALRTPGRRWRTSSPRSIADYSPTPAGLGVTVAWGLPYFRRLVPGPALRHLPLDRRAGRPAIEDARTFPSDPDATVLEANEVAILLRSDLRPHIDDAVGRLEGSGLLHLTSLRRGFAGGALEGGDSLPRQMAIAAGVPGADLIPEGAELFLGFTSTQKAAFGPGKIANFETLGYVDLRDSNYFREGTHLHLSHVAEDLEAWYVNFAFDERVTTAFKPGLDVPVGTQVVPQGPEQASTALDVRRQFHSSGRHRAQRVDPGDLAARPGRDRRRRHPLPEGHGDSDPRGLQHARQPVPLLGRAGRDPGGADGRDPLPRLQPVERRLQSQPARDGRCAPGRDRSRSRPATGRRASTRSSPPRTARTSSYRRGATAASPSPSSSVGRRSAGRAGRR